MILNPATTSPPESSEESYDVVSSEREEGFSRFVACMHNQQVEEEKYKEDSTPVNHSGRAGNRRSSSLLYARHDSLNLGDATLRFSGALRCARILSSVCAWTETGRDTHPTPAYLHASSDPREQGKRRTAGTVVTNRVLYLARDAGVTPQKWKLHLNRKCS